MANLNIPDNAIRRQIASAIDVVVQVSRLSDGTRKVISIAEITGMEGDVVTMQDIFVSGSAAFERTDEVVGEFVPTGIRPKFAERPDGCRNSVADVHVQHVSGALRRSPMELLIAVVTFIVVVLVVLGLWMLVGTDKQQDLIKKRMGAVRKAERRGEASLNLKLVRDELMSNVPMMHRILMRWSWSSRLQDYLVQAGMEVKPAKIILFSAVLTVGGYLLAGIFSWYYVSTIPAGLIVGDIPFVRGGDQAEPRRCASSRKGFPKRWIFWDARSAQGTLSLPASK